MIFYGTGEKKLHSNQFQKAKCPDCEQYGVSFHFFAKYAHLYWIPLFPYGRRVVAHCEKCDVAYENKRIPPALKNNLSEAKSSLGIPYILFSGLAIIAAVIFTISYFSDDMTTYKFPSGMKQAEGEMVRGEMEGEWNFWYENGNLESRQYYKNGTEDSLWTWYNEDGNIHKSGLYKDGMSHGLWTFYYPNSKKQSEGNYFENRQEGEWISWYESGEKYAQGKYDRSREEGKWTFWFENGQISEEGAYKDGLRSRTWISFYENGSKSSEIFYSEDGIRYVNLWKEDGTYLVKDGNGELRTYWNRYGQLDSKGELRDGKMVGDWSYWYEDGALMEEGRYKNEIYHLKNSWHKDGAPHIQNGNGVFTGFYENGTKSSEGIYKDGLQGGDWKFWTEDGMLFREMAFKNGLANGNYLSYNLENGNLESEGQMLDGEQDGLWKWYFLNGQKESQVNFKNGQKEGEQTFWSESEKIVKKEFYENGELQREETF